MPLYDVTYTDDYEVVSADLEKTELYVSLRKKLHGATWDRIVKTVEEAVENAAKDRSKLVWTKAGALFGHNSPEPVKHVNHLWDNVISIMGDGKLCLMSVGTLLRWVIAKRDETWLAFSSEIEEVDEDTGRKIRVSQYWIDDGYTFS